MLQMNIMPTTHDTSKQPEFYSLKTNPGIHFLDTVFYKFENNEQRKARWDKAENKIKTIPNAFIISRDIYRTPSSDMLYRVTYNVMEQTDEMYNTFKTYRKNGAPI